MEFKTKQERDRFILRNMKLVNWVIENKIKTYDFYEYDIRDLKQMGYIGLIKAVDNFDESKDKKFSTYAVPMIFGEITNKARTTKNGVKYGLKIMNNRYKINELKNYKNKSYEEIAKELNLTIDEVKEIERVSFKTYKLYDKTRVSSKQEDGVTYMDALREKYNFETDILINDLIERLNDREKEVLTLFIINDYTKKEIAEKVHLNVKTVNTIIKKSLEKIKRVRNYITKSTWVRFFPSTVGALMPHSVTI